METHYNFSIRKYMKNVNVNIIKITSTISDTQIYTGYFSMYSIKIQR